MIKAVDNSEDNDGDFVVWAYYIDHDGYSYGAVKHLFIIHPYSGEREITSLPCYPIRYMIDHEKRLDQLKQQGLNFQLYMEKNHLKYYGWTLTTGPDGEVMPTTDNKGTRSYYPEFIDSHVLVDFDKAFHNLEDWKPTFHQPTVYSDEWTSVDDEFPNIRWSGIDRRELISKSNDEVVQTCDGVTMWQRMKVLEKDEFLKACNERQRCQDCRQG
jgi:hypothetical protein